MNRAAPNRAALACVSRIAQEQLFIASEQPDPNFRYRGYEVSVWRSSDGDAAFHELPVDRLREALLDAYIAGLEAR